ncbi:MAG: hypothetical protein U0Q18_34380 [Bryobacteraceae bacterium]
MAQSAAISWKAQAIARADTIPWYLWACVIAVTSASIGGVWDISWHESIGRDTFWTAPHLFIQFGGILAGAASAFLIFRTTFVNTAGSQAGTVRIWGFRGPLGAFVCCWGGVAMVTSAPFDNWWHGAYGLDVKILSPPHVLLILGLLVIRFGTVLLILGAISRAEGALRSRLHALLLYSYTFVLGVAVGVFQEFTFSNYMHSALFYLVLSIFTPLFLAAITRISDFRWACTAVTGIFTTLNLLFLWILPLFPAEPKLGPVYYHVTHFIPPPFPLLLIVPALAWDLMRPKLSRASRWLYSAMLGALFLGSFAAVQWPFAEFLHSPASRNWVFGTHYFPFFVPPASDWVRNVFTRVEATPAAFWERMGIALGVAVIGTRMGLSLGESMRRIRR